LLITLVAQYIEITDTRDTLLSVVEQPFKALCKRQTSEIVDNVQALSDCLKSGKSLENVVYKSVPQAINAVINWNNHYKEFVSKYFENDKTMIAAVKEVCEINWCLFF